MILGIDPKNDYAFKKLFGSESNEALLLSLLNATLASSIDEPLNQVDIPNPFSELDAADDKLSILDIKARDRSGRMYNIEMEMAPAWYYPKRVLYYLAGIYHSQLGKGQNYDELKPVISISFVNRRLFHGESFHRQFGLLALDDPSIVFCPDVAIHVIELPKFSVPAERLGNEFERWCWFLRNADKLEPADLPDKLRTAPIERAVEVLRVMNQTERERQRYLDRERAIRDRDSWEAYMKSLQQDATQRAMQLGQQLGQRQGFLSALEIALETRFGDRGKELFAKVRDIDDDSRLQSLHRAIFTVQSVDEMRDLAQIP